MKAFLARAWAYILTPLILGMYWYTGHNAWLYIFGVLSVVIIIFGGIALAAVWTLDDDQLIKAAKAKPISTFRVYAGSVYQIATITFLLWQELWANATLFLIGLAIIWPLIILFRRAARHNEESSK